MDTSLSYCHYALNDTSLALTDMQAEAVVGYCKWGAALGALAGVWLLRRGHTLCFWLSSLAFVSGPLLLAGAPLDARQREVHEILRRVLQPLQKHRIPRRAPGRVSRVCATWYARVAQSRRVCVC